MKKLLLLTLFSGFSFNINSQVYNAGTIFSGYADINPDSLLYYTVVPFSVETTLLNMFGDSSIDIELRASGAVSSGGTAQYINVISHTPGVYMRFGRLDSVFVPANSLWYVTEVAKPLILGEQIDPPGAIWHDTMLYLSDHSSFGGGTKDVNDWIGGDKYIGLKYQSGSSLAYGWIRLECISQDSCYVKEYSYTPAIVGMNERNLNETLIYPNPLSRSFCLKNISQRRPDPATIQLRNMYAKQVRFTWKTSGDDISVELDEALPDGCYLLQYLSEGSLVTEKIIKMAAR